MVRGIVAFDEVEAGHRDEALRWLASTDDVFRRVKPAIPSPHLVSYVVVIDPVDRSSLLVDHLNAKLWLPPGGHVEPDEDPRDAARREASEELGVDAELVDALPAFITVTETVGVDHGHTDVSLWFVVHGRRGMPLVTDPAEFREARWWTREQVRAAGAGVFDPHYPRFVAKLAGWCGVGSTGVGSASALGGEDAGEEAGVEGFEVLAAEGADPAGALGVGAEDAGFAQGAEVVGPGGSGDREFDVAARDALGCVGQSADDL